MNAPNTYAVPLILVAHCGSCSQPRAVVRQGCCPVCGEALPPEQVAAVRAAVRARRQAFKVALGRFGVRLEALVNSASHFATRGTPLSVIDHIEQVIQRATDRLKDPNPRIKQLLESCTWDPGEAGTIESFSDLIRELDASLAWITSLRDTMPPIEWRGVHRELVRAALAILQGQAAMAFTIVATDLDDALRLQGEAQQWFDRAEALALRLSRQVSLINDSPPEGPFQRDGSLDVAAAAWAGVGRVPTSFGDIAEIVRVTFADVPGISGAPPEHLALFLPAVATTAWAVDHDLLVKRARQLREVLDAADATGVWIADHSLVVEQVMVGLDRMADDAERLGREWRHGLPRRHVMRTLTEVYRESVEGAFCDLGGVILVAARASRQETGAQYEAEVVDGIKAGEIVTEFMTMGPPVANSIRMLYRNASAHASVVVTETGIIATQKEIRDGRARKTSDILSDAEFMEEFVSLMEMLLALELAIVPWMLGHGDPAMVAARNTMPLSARQRDQAIALVAGAIGLSNVAVEAVGDELTITADGPEDGGDEGWLGEVLTVVAGAFGIVPAPSRVTFALSGITPVTFSREEFVGSDGQVQTPVHVGLVMAKWMMAITGTLQLHDETTFLTLPLAAHHLECASLASTDSAKALDSLRRVRAQLDLVLPGQQRSAVLKSVVEQLDYLADFLDGLADGARGILSSAELDVLDDRASKSVEAAQRFADLARSQRQASLESHRQSE